MPVAFDDHRGIHYPKGDVIDVTAHELCSGRRHIGDRIGSVAKLDDGLALCGEHMARYVIL